MRGRRTNSAPSPYSTTSSARIPLPAASTKPTTTAVTARPRLPRAYEHELLLEAEDRGVTGLRHFRWRPPWRPIRRCRTLSSRERLASRCASRAPVTRETSGLLKTPMDFHGLTAAVQ